MSEPLIDTGTITAAHRKLVTVYQDNGIFTIGFGANLLYMLEVNNGRTMHPQKHLRVELLFQVGHSFAKQMCLGLRADANVILLCTNPANV
jgi:hypothetical protein